MPTEGGFDQEPLTPIISTLVITLYFADYAAANGNAIPTVFEEAPAPNVLVLD